MHVFRDMVIVHNNSDTAATGCVITIDDAITGELGNAPAHQAVKLMRSRFRPYVEMDEFYQRGTIRKRLDCSAPSGPVRVEFGPSTEHSVVIPPKK